MLRKQLARYEIAPTYGASVGGLVAGFAEGPAAEEHSALLFHAVGLGRHAGAHPPRALRRGARAGRT